MHINRKIERFLIQYSFSATRFGREVANDPRLVPDMRRGRVLGDHMIRRAETFMEQYCRDPSARLEETV